MGDDRREAWQFANVAEWQNAARLPNLGEAVPLRVQRRNAPLGADVGTPLNPLVVTAPYLKIVYGLPADPPEGPLTGKVRVLRRDLEFSRNPLDDVAGDAVVIVDVDHVAELGSLPRDEELPDHAVLDQDLGQPGKVWYYTVFYEVDVGGTDTWAFSSEYGHARNWPLDQLVDETGDPKSRLGEWAYAELPRRWRSLDEQHGFAVRRILHAFGRTFDEVSERTTQRQAHAYNVSEMDAQYIPYVDWLMAWPTNFEVSENIRRKETEQASLLWKSKGTRAALELALQTTTRWDVSVVEGADWVLYAPAFDRDAYLDPLAPPSGWNEPTDGVWADLVNALPFNGAPDFSTVAANAFSGTPSDPWCRCLDTSVVSEFGVGWRWQNPNGLLIVLEEIPGVSGPLSEALLRRVRTIAPLFAAHFATFEIMIEALDVESYDPFGALSEFWEDALATTNTEAYLPLAPEEEDDRWRTTEFGAVYAWPHPTHADDCVAASFEFLNFHSVLFMDGPRFNGFRPMFGMQVPDNSVLKLAATNTEQTHELPSYDTHEYFEIVNLGPDVVYFRLSNSTPAVPIVPTGAPLQGDAFVPPSTSRTIYKGLLRYLAVKCDSGETATVFAGVFKPFDKRA